jgi:hypothetical protein
MNEIKRIIFHPPVYFRAEGGGYNYDEPFKLDPNARDTIDQLNDYIAAHRITRAQIVSIQEHDRGSIVLFYEAGGEGA